MPRSSFAFELPLYDTIFERAAEYLTKRNGYTLPIVYDVDAQCWRQQATGEPVDFPGPVKHQTVQFPFLPPFPPLRRSVPRVVHTIWIGGDMPAHLLDNLRHNRACLPDWSFILHLDVGHEHGARIAASLKASGIDCRALRDGPAFTEAKAKEAVTRNAIRQYEKIKGMPIFAAAADVARYLILREGGGLYLDVDDRIDTPFPASLQADAEMLLTSALSAVDGVEFHGVNNSNLACQPNNPLLNAILEKSYERFGQNEATMRAAAGKADIRASASKADIHATASEANCRHVIFNTTGPQLLTDVMRQYDAPAITLLDLLPTVRSLSRKFINAPYLAQFQALLDVHFPLQELVSIGNEGSWKPTVAAATATPVRSSPDATGDASER